MQRGRHAAQQRCDARTLQPTRTRDTPFHSDHACQWWHACGSDAGPASAAGLQSAVAQQALHAVILTEEV